MLEPPSLPAFVKALSEAMRTDPTERARIQAAAGRVLAAKKKLKQRLVPHPAC